MALSASALLTQIESAIEALLSGGASSYSIGNRSVSKIDLEDLMRERRVLKAEVERESAGSAFRVAKIRRPSP